MEVNIENEEALKTVAQQFIESVDAQNAEQLQAVLLDGAQQHLLYQGKHMMLTTEQYIGMMKAGKVGGKKRSMEIINFDSVGETTATIKVKAKGEAGPTFTYYLSLLKIEGNWKIVGVLTHVG
ncbi:nuclear transport factor 2 family protein [Fulvivirgaceae bacterium BMA10]|uniref:Nuclear transport factor 2 family protein n=1 Tax=Splendidivirga corallicola TaxID=3051826 RepID=A0ABT8L0B8_9BACT|nr:nuclear transport factor 2 family protein [Fulvivirgaceae bacterium BMA10]